MVLDGLCNKIVDIPRSRPANLDWDGDSRSQETENGSAVVFRRGNPGPSDYTPKIREKEGMRLSQSR